MKHITLNKKLNTNKIFTYFNLLSSKKDENNLSIFSNYYLIGRRASYYIINPFAVNTAISRIFILLKEMHSEGKGGRHIQKWILSFNPKHAGICRWFGWSIGASIFAKLTKNYGILSNGGIVLGISGSLVTYTFTSYIGIDLAFILSSKSSGGRAALITQKSIITVGFDASDSLTYAYNLPGIRSYRSIILYSRIFSFLLNKII